MIDEKPAGNLADKPLVWGGAVAVLALAAVLYWYNHRTPAVTPPPIEVSAPVASQAAAEPGGSEPVIEHPLPQDSAPAPTLSDLDHSDAQLLSLITALPNGAAILRQLMPENIVRHMVAAVDNLPKNKLAANLRPFKSTPGGFITNSAGAQLTISVGNYTRYKDFVDMVKGLDVERTLDLYFKVYPLFQTAFDDLGYASGYFNDRVVHFIDQLLATPELSAPPELVQPNVLYQYADPNLEALSAGQKTLLRMGPENAAVVKSKLRQIRAGLLARERR